MDNECLGEHCRSQVALQHRYKIARNISFKFTNIAAKLFWTSSHTIQLPCWKQMFGISETENHPASVARGMSQVTVKQWTTPLLHSSKRGTTPLLLQPPVASHCLLHGCFRFKRWKHIHPAATSFTVMEKGIHLDHSLFSFIGICNGKMWGILPVNLVAHFPMVSMVLERLTQLHTPTRSHSASTAILV